MQHTPTISIVRRRTLRWFTAHRRDLPWRRTHNPYRIAVSEVMLQQTQVDRVKPKFLAWIQRWPTTEALARASLYEVLTMWSGLGYNSRGKRLRDAARAVVERFDGRWPKHVDELESLPGFGPYTARAVASFAHNAEVAVIDTNVRRVVSRIFFGVRKLKPNELEALAGQVVPSGKSREWHSALMDFGSAICTSRAPQCQSCPMRKYCRAYPTILHEPTPLRKSSARFQDTDRYWRGAIVRGLLKQSPQTISTLVRQLPRPVAQDRKRIVRLLGQLCHEGLLVQCRRGYGFAQ